MAGILSPIGSRLYALGVSSNTYSSFKTSSFDPAKKRAGIVLNAQNYICTLPSPSSGQYNVVSQSPRLGGRYYAEFVLINYGGDSNSVGLSPANEFSVTSAVGTSADGAIAYQLIGSIFSNGTQVGTQTQLLSGDVVGILYDASALKVYFTKNGVYKSGDIPQSGVGGYPAPVGANYLVASMVTSNDAWVINTGWNNFYFQPPSSFAPWG